jgi:hypothetical protein
VSFRVLNLAEARFECTFGKGCPGVCCRDGRPPIYPEDAARIGANLEKFLPRMRPIARKWLERDGFLTRRVKSGQPTLRVVDGWCIFFNEGCVLHAAGDAEGDKLRYKPAMCSLFPLEKNLRGEWYVRQKGFAGESWDLPCLDPSPKTAPAAESLREELALAGSFEQSG